MFHVGTFWVPCIQFLVLCKCLHVLCAHKNFGFSAILCAHKTYKHKTLKYFGKIWCPHVHTHNKNAFTYFMHKKRKKERCEGKSFALGHT
jgi:hypothetical protein